jgi:hypothetical protein
LAGVLEQLTLRSGKLPVTISLAKGPHPVVPKFGPKPLKRPRIHRQDAETLDGTSNKGSNHPKMNGKLPSSPLNPHHPAPTVTRGRAGTESDFLSVHLQPTSDRRNSVPQRYTIEPTRLRAVASPPR